MTSYYNEIDPVAAQWLRNLIAAGHIAPGVVDERSIEDVRPDELAGYVQCHFFAGIGVWSYALRQAGVPDDYPVWTGSCPCQPFSAAGAGAGFADERHLWPAFFHLIRECRPAVVLGEQVASKDAEPWIDLVCADLGSLGYASGAVAFPAASVGAPHIRDRLYWAGALGIAEREGLEGRRQGTAAAGRGQRSVGEPAGSVAAAGGAGGLAHADEGQRGSRRAGAESEDGAHVELAGRDSAGGLADADGERFGATRASGAEHEDVKQRGGADRPGPVNGFWRAADWLACRDGKWRPVEPGTFPLAHGAAGRVGRLRAYGNAICAPAAQAFIEAVMEAA